MHALIWLFVEAYQLWMYLGRLCLTLLVGVSDRGLRVSAHGLVTLFFEETWNFLSDTYYK